MERFAGLNICSFNPTEVFVEILLHCLAKSTYYLRLALIYMEKFRSTLINRENRESLVQLIFPLYSIQLKFCVQNFMICNKSSVY